MNVGGMKRPVLTLFLLLSSLCEMPAEAQLVWQNREQRRSVEVERAETSFSFYFQNGGTETFEITKVVKGCSCLSETLEKRVFAPGEQGVLQVTMSLNEFEGNLNKSLMVVTSDHPDAPVRLSLSVHIPKGYQLSTRRLVWEPAESGAKTCRLVNQSDVPIPLVSATCSTPDFTVELVPVREGFEYEVSICPVDGSVPARATVRIQVAAPQDGAPARSYSISLVNKG
jgi:hypothetical protein